MSVTVHMQQHESDDMNVCVKVSGATGKKRKKKKRKKKALQVSWGLHISTHSIVTNETQLHYYPVKKSSSSLGDTKCKGAELGGDMQRQEGRAAQKVAKTAVRSGSQL